ncbi:MAG TPA: carboxypeptidase-like regulatory domain-containing protein [Chthoniobacterales bacterium]|nr:carboxypeptidase-like regulatory domain-containing protein [Chthoniobacterales bacterium]
MKKNPNPKSGLFNPRVLLGCALCSVGVCLAMLSFAAPASTKKLTPQSSAQLKPVVIESTVNGVSLAVRDLPTGVPTGPREIEHGLLRVKPNRPVPAGFVDKAVQQAVQPSLGVLAAAPAPMANFEGQSSVDSGGGSAAGCLCVPPDTNGAVGPTQYVQMVNTVFSVYDKAGTRLSGPTAINALFSALPASSRCRATNDGDPVVVYDQLADRWLLSQFAVRDNAGGTNGPYEQCIAISQTSDATGAYYVYDFPLSTTKFEDYPHLGLWPDAYYMTTHQFNQAGTAYLGQAAWAFERDRMLKGQPAQLLYFDLGPVNTGFGGQLPANLDGFSLPPAGSPNYFVEVDSSADTGLGNNLRIWKFHVDWITPANSSFGVAGLPNSITPVTDFARPNCMNDATGCVPQAGDVFQLDPIGDRLMYRLAYRNFGDHESLVLNHTVVANATTGQMGPRWYEVRDPGGTPQIFQQSTWGPISQTDLLYRWMSSVAMDHAGNMAIGYSTSSQINFPSIAYAGRLAGDPVSTLAQSETQLFAGTGPQHGEIFAPQFGRWGDYTDMTVDPVDDCTFWYTNEYFSATDAPSGIWHTRVGSFKFPQCTPRQIGTLRGTITDSSTSNPIAGASVTAGGYTAVTNGSGFYQFSPLAPGGYTDTASATGYFSSSSAVTVTNGGVTTQNFALARNLAVPTPTPPPPSVLRTVNPPVLNDPGATITTNNYTLTWSAAEVTAGLASYVVEESTDYVNPLFDNADATLTPPQTVGPLWTTSPSSDPWTQNPAYHNSLPNSYFGNAQSGAAADTSLTLASNVTIPNTVSSARLSFYSRYFNDPDDTGSVEISTNNGTTWSSLRILTDAPSTPPADTRVQSQEIDLSAYRGVPFKLQFRFSNGTLLYFLIRSVGWWVDDINVDGATWHQIGTTGPGTTSLNLTNKPNGHYYYRVRGVYNNGNLTTNSNVQDIVVNFPLTTVVSRMTHGTITPPFDVSLPLPPSPRGVECRSSASLGAGNYTMVFKFPNNLMSVTGASVTGHDPTGGTGTVGSSMVDSSDTHNYIVNLTGVSNGQYITVTLNNVHDVAGNIGNVTGPQMGVLFGDVNATGGVDGNDVSDVQSHTRQPVTNMNFRDDVNVTGGIDGNDVSLTQSQTRTSLPQAP